MLIGRNMFRYVAIVFITSIGFAQTSEKCVLAGTVFNSATHAGIPHALVSYVGFSGGYRFTDAGGNFQVANVPCLQYALTVSKAGFVSGQEEPAQQLLMRAPRNAEPEAETSDQGPQPPHPAIVMVDVKSGSPSARISLVPVSSIVGTVLDENGEPLEGVVVQSIAAKVSLAGIDYVPRNTARTDDRGIYTILGLAPGDYLLRLVGEVSDTRYFMGNTVNLSNDHRGLPPIYYPNADSLSAASVLHLAAGERTTADFKQATEAAYDISGQMTGFVAQAWTRLKLYRDGEGLPLGRAFVNISSGQFRIVDVPHGNYTLRIEQYQADPAKWLAAEEQVAVSSEPIRNLLVPLSAGVDIPVSVSYEGGATEGGMVNITLQPGHTRANQRQLQLGRIPKLPQGPDVVDVSQVPPAESASPANPSVLTGLIPDQYRLQVQFFGHGGYVASAKLGDVDVLHGKFPVGESMPGELHITIRGDGAELEGQVTLSGRPAEFAQVYLIPTSDPGAQVKFGFGAEGHYKIVGVAPGDYKIQAWIGAPTAKDILTGSGETLSVQPGEHRSMALEAKQASDSSVPR